MMKSLLTTLLLITGISIAQPPPGTFLPPSYPQTISFQAMMTDTLGNPVADGTHNFTFRISSPTQGGAEIFWEETKQVDVVDGVVSTILGSVTPIEFLPFRDDLHLDVALDNELISVNPLTSVPFALMSSRAMRAYNATHADTANFTHQAGHAMHADTAHFTHQADHAMHADTAHFVMNAPMSDTANFSHQAGHAHHADSSGFAHHTQHAVHADTAYFVMNAPTADTAHFAHQADHAMHADTANFSHQTNHSLTSDSSDYSDLSHRATYADTADYVHGVTATATELNYVDGVTSALQTQLNGKQAADADLTDLADGTLSASKVEKGGYFISSAGTSGQVWTSDGDSTGAWATTASTTLSDLQVTATAAELNIMDGVTSSAAELNLLDGVTVLTTSVNGLSDALIEDNSMYIGNDPSSTTNSAQYNLAVGTTALDAVTTGDENVAVGYNALSANTTGYKNVAVGNHALNANTEGMENVAISGNTSLYNNTTGSQNVAIGAASLYNNETGNQNIAIGRASLYSNTVSNNVGIGHESLKLNTTGTSNTALGYNAGNVLTTGSNNVILGSGSDPSANSGTNQIVIGKGATGHGDNIAVIGNGSNTAIHPHDNNEVDLGSSSYKFKNLHLAGSALVGVASTITSSATFNGAETIIPVNTSSGSITITIDSDQKVAGRILIFKQIAGVGNSFTIATEGSEQIQGHLGVGLDDTYQANSAYQTVNLFCDGSNWYDLDG